MAGLVACSTPPPPSASAVIAGVPASAAPVAWFRGPVDAALATARAQRKPVFMYWGTDACSGCAQVEVEVFADPRFLERSADFIALYVDAEDFDAHALAAHYDAHSLPTTLLLSADGVELGRVPAGYLGADAYLAALDALLKSRRPVADLLVEALDDKPLEAAEWLAVSQAPRLNRPAFADSLAVLAERCPVQHLEAARRFRMGALLSTPASVELLWSLYGDEFRHVLAEPALAREHLFRLLRPLEVLDAIPAGERREVREQWQATLLGLADDPDLSARARMLALDTAVELSADGATAAPPEIEQQVRSLVAKVDRQARTPLQRQAAIGAAATVLASLGDPAAAEALVAADLTNRRGAYRSAKLLAEWAAERGDVAAELGWLRRSHQEALASGKLPVALRYTGAYLLGLLEKGPERRDEIVGATTEMLAHAATGARHFTRERLKWMQRHLRAVAAWSRERDRAALRELQPRLHAFCERLERGLREECAVLLSP